MQSPVFSKDNKSGREWSAKYIQRENNQAKTGLLEWWYRWTAPAIPPPTASLEERELTRRGRLTSLVLLSGVAIATFIGLPAVAFQNPSLVAVILPLDLLFLVALWFNRRGQIYVAGLIVLVDVSIGLPISILTTPGGLSANSMPLYDLMVQAELFAISLLPAGTIFIVAAINSAFIVLDFNLQTHTTDLNTMVAKAGPEVLARPIILHFLVAVVLYLWVRSATQAIKRADRAEVIAILEHDMAEQAHAVAQQKRQLDVSIQHIVETHTRIANGDMTARVPLTHDSVLWEVAGALNNLLTRFQRAIQAEHKMHELQRQLQWALQVDHEMKRTKKGIEKQIEIIRKTKYSQNAIRFARTGTMIDPLLAELDGMVIPKNLSGKSSPLPEDFARRDSSPLQNDLNTFV